MPIPHLLLAVLIAAIWGFNFIFVKLALTEMPPLLLCALRFFFASVPLILFIKPPAAPFKLIALYGLINFGVQFSFVFVGIQVGMTPGLASLIMQVQVFFSMFFAVLFLAEIPRLWQILGALIAFCGIGVVAMHLDNNVTLAGFILMISAAAAWGLGNLFSKKIGHVNIIALVVWGSLVAFLPILLLSFQFEGIHALSNTLQSITWVGIISIMFIVCASTWIAYGAWNWLLSRYPVPMIVPFTLLVPVFGMLGSSLFLGEPFQSWKVIAALLVMAGLGVNLLGAKLFVKK